jgi:hypothetical protein
MTEFTGETCILCGKSVLYRSGKKSDILTICSKCKEKMPDLSNLMITLDAFEKVIKERGKSPVINMCLQMYLSGKCTLIDALSLIIIGLKEESDFWRNQAISKSKREPITLIIQKGDET